jgi:hypothetical protein
MSVRIRTQAFQGAGGPQPPLDTYFDKVIKYIPSDIVGAWVAATGLIKTATGVPTEKVLWISFAFGLVATAAWKFKQTHLPIQAAISTGAFLVWVFALPGGPFEPLSWYNHLYGSLALIGYTLTTALVNPD